MNTPTLREQISGLIQLTRWKEYLPFVIPLTVVGGLLATSTTGQTLDWRLLAVTIGNVLVVAYAFMINDIEDAADDARDPDRAARNPISSGRIGVRFGYAACRLVAAVTLLFYIPGGFWVILIGIATLLLSHFYSWRPVRLKAWPITDIVSHSLMLSGLLLLAGYFTYGYDPGVVWLVAAGVTLVSVYGQLYNQLRDFEMDKAAGLHNTAIMLGEKNTQRAMYMTIGLAAACLIIAAAYGVFPFWLGLVALAGIPISLLLAPRTDMRGGAAADISGSLQIQSIIILNLTICVWLIEVLVRQMFLS